MAENQYTKRLLSADSHVMEPRDLWETRIDKKWRDKAPHIAKLDESGDYIVIDGMRPRPLAFEGPMADMKAQGMEIPVPKGYRYEQNRPGSWDPNERLKDQDLDGVSGEVIYPGVGLHIVRAPDAEYIYACCRAYNDWLAEYCSVHPQRLKGAAMLPNRGPIENAVKEAQRAAKLGFATIMLPAWVDDRAYNLPDWDALWARIAGFEPRRELASERPRTVRHRAWAGRGRHQRWRDQVHDVRHRHANYLGRRADAVSEAQVVDGRRRYRLDRVSGCVHGPLVGRPSRMDGAEAGGDSEFLFSPPIFRHVRG